MTKLFKIGTGTCSANLGPEKKHAAQLVLMGALLVFLGVQFGLRMCVHTAPPVVYAAAVQISKESERPLSADASLSTAAPPGNGLHLLCLVHISNLPHPASPRDINLTSLATFYLYAYSQLHGYFYLSLYDPSGSGRRHGIWTRPRHLITALSQCETAVLFDHDLLFADFNVPLTSLLRDWGFFRPEVLVLQAADPDTPNNRITLRNGSSLLQANTGFMALKRHPRTEALLRLWVACRGSRGDPACGGYELLLGSEQFVWNAAVRQQFRQGELVVVGCSEANGFPLNLFEFSEWTKDRVGRHNCRGEKIRHVWFEKELLRKRLRFMFPPEVRAVLLAQLRRGGHLQTVGVGTDVGRTGLGGSDGDSVAVQPPSLGSSAGQD